MLIYFCKILVYTINLCFVFVFFSYCNTWILGLTLSPRPINTLLVMYDYEKMFHVVYIMKKRCKINVQ